MAPEEKCEAVILTEPAPGSKAESDTQAEKIRIPRVLAAAPHSGSGKTLLACGLLRLLQKKGMRPAAFKCGPDYIDPMFHRQILKVPSRNLDTFFSPGTGTEEILARAVLETGSLRKNGSDDEQRGKFPEETQQAGVPLTDPLHMGQQAGMSRAKPRHMGQQAGVPLTEPRHMGQQAGVPLTDPLHMGQQAGMSRAKPRHMGQQAGMSRAKPRHMGQQQTGLLRTLPYKKNDIAVIEGVMGFFDGTGESGSEASSFDLAHRTKTPVILIVDAKGMGRSVSALVRGFRDYEKQLLLSQKAPSVQQSSTVSLREKSLPEKCLGEKSLPEECFQYKPLPAEPSQEESLPTDSPLIRAVFLNRISPGMYPVMKRWIEEDTGLPVIGYLPANEKFALESRHLGLLMPEEIRDLESRTELLADTLCETLDLEKLLEIAGAAPELKMPSGQRGHKERELSPDQGAPRVSIAVAWDEAFRFYYEDNLEQLEEAGAELVFFSPLHDRALPEADGILLGGGYPELYARCLAENHSMKESIRRRAAEGMPILAECGGFMYLQEFLEDQNGDPQPMCGVLQGSCRRTDRLVRFGYVELEGNAASPETGYLLEGHRIRGHEFHYYDSTETGEACMARKPGRKLSWPCMTASGNIMAGFPHLYYRSDPEFAAGFVQRCRREHEKTSRP